MSKAELITENIASIKRYSINKLAGILFECVEHAHPRDLADWFTAENYVNDSMQEHEWRCVTGNFLSVCAYTEMSAKSALPKIEWSYQRDIFAHGPSCGAKLEQMQVSDEEFARLIGRIQPAKKAEYSDQFLGRFVWNRMYQHLRKSSRLQEQEYGRVIYS